MTPTSSNRYEYPKYYVLDINDIASEFIDSWNRVVASEVPAIERSSVHPEVYQELPDGSLASRVFAHSVVSPAIRQWHPDVSIILMHVIDAIKQQRDIETDLQLLEFDIASMTHYQLTQAGAEMSIQRYSSTRMRLAKLARQFGLRVYYKLIEYNIYRNGYFPYHFAGWQGEDALVELDETHLPTHGPY